MRDALAEANERAWKSIEVALVGNRWRDDVFASSTDRNLRETMRAFVETVALPAGGSRFISACLAELRLARSKGELGADREFQTARLEDELGPFAKYDDPDAILDAECAVVQEVGRELARMGYSNLGKLLQATPTRGQPLLAMAAQFYFRQAVVENDRLNREVTWVKLVAIDQKLEEGFNTVILLLARHGESFEALMAGQAEITEITVETRDGVLELHQEVKRQMEELRLMRRELTAGHSASYRDEHERAMIRAVRQRYRNLSDQERRRFPQVGLDMARLEMVAGDFLDALSTAKEAAEELKEPTAIAEAHHAAFRAALELQRWDEALMELRAAVAGDSRYALWPKNRHRIDGILGAGAFGVALRAWDPYLQRQVVLKSFEPAGIDRDVATVFREAQVHNSLRHPAIIELYQCGFADEERKERPYLEIEHFEGSVTLDFQVREHGSVPADELRAMARQIASAMQAAHAREILHRDLKPANLLVRKRNGTWEVKVIDFGLALRRSLVRAGRSQTGGRGKSMVGSAVAGTWGYAAPEQLDEDRADEVGPHSDVYGFGRTCYFAMTGEAAPDLHDIWDLPEAWSDLLADCTAKRIERRPKDFAAVLERLEAMAAPTEHVPTARPEVPKSGADLEAALMSKAPTAIVSSLIQDEQTRGADAWISLKARDRKVLQFKDQEIAFRWCPPGSFVMGSPKDEEGRSTNEDQVDVTLTRGFWMMETPVTQGLWTAVKRRGLWTAIMGSNPSHFKGSAELPVEQVDWQVSHVFATILGKELQLRGVLPTNWKLALPTEAQWEYAARGGTTSRFSFGYLETDLGDHAWYKGNSGYKTHAVRQKRSNAWGLHDMLGNVWEWCEDWYQYKLPGGVDPVVRSERSWRMVRGGGWSENPAYCRPAFRRGDAPDFRCYNLGFRLAAVQE